MGTNQKFIVVAIGQIFQFIQSAYQYFICQLLIPSLSPSIVGEFTKLLAKKNPESKIGTKASWSKTTKVNTLLTLCVL